MSQSFLFRNDLIYCIPKWCSKHYYIKPIFFYGRFVRKRSYHFCKSSNFWILDICVFGLGGNYLICGIFTTLLNNIFFGITFFNYGSFRRSPISLIKHWWLVNLNSYWLIKIVHENSCKIIILCHFTVNGNSIHLLDLNKDSRLQ